MHTCLVFCSDVMKELADLHREQVSQVRDCHIMSLRISSLVLQPPHVPGMEINMSVQASHQTISP